MCLLSGYQSAGELRAAGCTVRELKDGGFAARELRKGGYSAEDLLAGGFGHAELKEGEPTQLIEHLTGLCSAVV